MVRSSKETPASHTLGIAGWRRWRIELVSSLHDALPVAQAGAQPVSQPPTPVGSAVLGGEGF
jgi:hypothetical protein